MKRVTPFLLALALCAGLAVPALAAQIFTVTFYTDSTMTTVHETQQVPMMGHPTVPSDPAYYDKDGFRYVFDQWYWTIDGRPYAFSFTADEDEIWSDASIYAGYTQYLAPGYRMIVTKADGSAEFVEDTSAPVSELLSRYPNFRDMRVERYQQGTEGKDPLDANGDDAVTVVDASVFLSQKNYENAAAVLRKVVGLS